MLWVSLRYPKDICTDRLKGWATRLLHHSIKRYKSIAGSGSLNRWYVIYNHPIGSRCHLYTTYIWPNWVIICYLPPIKGTWKLHWTKHQFGRITTITKILSVIPYQKTYSVTGLHSCVWEYLYAGTCEFEHVLCYTCIPPYFTSRFHSFHQK